MAQLNKQRIAATALAIVDKQGAAGFTIRTVADALGVTAMALYRHVKDKAELASLVVDAANRHSPLPASTGDWRADLWAMAQWNRKGALAHPGVRELWRSYPVFTPELSRISDRWVSLWQQSGLSLEKAVLAATMSNVTINGLISEEEIYRGMEPLDEAALTRLPDLRLALAIQPNPDEMYEFTVKSLIDGLHARLLKAPAPKQRPRGPANARLKRVK